jgi:hypothetical protein
MTYSGIKYLSQHNVEQLPKDQDALRLLNHAVPGLRYLARPSCAHYLECQPEALTQEQIAKYVLRNYDFDAVDISKIIAELNKYVAEHTAGT